MIIYVDERMRGLVMATMVFRGVEYGLSGHYKVGVKKKKNGAQ